MFVGYYLYGSHDLLSNVPAFFSHKMQWSWAFGLFVWVVWAIILASPYLLLKKKSAMGFVAAVLLVFLPPIGVFGWMSPLNAAGHLFPATAAIGLILTLVFMAIIAVGRGPVSYYVSALILASSVGLNAFDFMEVSKKQSGMDRVSIGTGDSRVDLVSINTSLPHNGDTTPLQDMENIWIIQKTIKDTLRKEPPRGVTYVILPEEVLGAWRTAKAFWMGDFIREMADRQVILIAGADKERLNERLIYDDAALILMPASGDNKQNMAMGYKLTSAKIPMPGGNWNFMGLGNGKSARLDILGKFKIKTPGLNGNPVYFSFCYEDFLIWPHALFFYRNNEDVADVWISMANNWFQTDDALAFYVQERSIKSTARLFGANLLRSVNKKTLVYKK